MPAKIRLARHGKKKYAYFHIVVADSRAPRDGKFIERIGMYNPNTNPATIELDFNKALKWLQNGAQPTDTCKAILSYKGILYKNHLLKGVTKGALTEDVAEAKFQEWLSKKESKIQQKKDRLGKEKDSVLSKRLDAETKAAEAKAAEIAKKNAKLAEKAAEAASEESASETPEAAAPEETPQA